MCGDKPRWSKLAKDVKLIRVQANSISQLHISIYPYIAYAACLYKEATSSRRRGGIHTFHPHTLHM